MDTELSFHQLRESQNLCSESLKKDLDEHCFAMEDKNAAVVPPSSISVGLHRGEAFVPVTPDSNKESGDFLLDFTSPLTLVTSPLLKPHCLYSQQSDDMCSPDDDSPHTPKEGVFDPFAPGPEKLMLAPHGNKVLEQSQSYVARRLEFDSFSNTVPDESCEGDSESVPEEEMFVEAMYRGLLEIIFSKQVEGFLGQVSPQDDGSDGFKTPTSAPLNGFADTCPGAPTKATRKLRNIDPELCRKLEF